MMFKQGALPVSQPCVGVRKRLSLRMGISSPSLGAAFRRSKSVGDGLLSWWDWGWSWILSRKPTFAKDLEMNEEEKTALGCHNKGSWRHVFYKVKSRLFGFGCEGLPTKTNFRYDSKNFDEQSSLNRRAFSHFSS